MQLSSFQSRLKLPESLRAQMVAFRRRVWSIKLIEAACGALFVALVCFLATFALDRLLDTPSELRFGLLGVALFGFALVPFALYRWVWRRRRLDQLARLLSLEHPRIGDQLLGVIELVQSESEQARSLALCEAAVQQVAAVAGKSDFSGSVPNPRHRRRALCAGLVAAVALAVAALVPEAAANAWVRFATPWGEAARYTFTRVEPLPDRLVVAHGEPFSVMVRLAESTSWRPQQGKAQLQEPANAPLREGSYQFDLPAQIDAGWLRVRIGDFTKSVRIEPTLRPELTSLVAEVKLPEYLGRPQPISKDVRGGSISLVKGSSATFTAEASRALAASTVDGLPRAPADRKITSAPLGIDADRKVVFQWQDELGLTGKEPFTLSVSSRQDEAPSLSCDDLPRQKVVLDSEVLDFKVKAQDDYGVRLVGMDWQGIDTTTVKEPAKGERILSGGGNDKETIELDGTFCAKSLGIEAQPINVRLFVEDYLPGRERVYSPTYVLFVLNAEQHAIWLTEMLSKWHRQSMEVRDREMQLLETNKQLRALTPEELDLADTRKRIETQAAAERANGRRLSGLVATGEDLVRQATRNPEFGVAHLDKWAEMLQILKDISSNRMPSVADLLKQAAQAPVLSSTPVNQGPMVGQVRASGPSAGSTGSSGKPNPNTVPTIADVESSQQPPPDSEGPPAPGGNSSPRLGLAQTMLMGASKPGGPTPPAGEAMDDAVAKQQDLLAEFEKVADELNRILANLEGSTLVKRLKAASRLQTKVAGRLADQVTDAFGRPASATKAPQAKLFAELSDQEAKSSNDVSTIMDDMLSYFERRRLVKFKEVLDEMRKQDVVGNLRQLGDDLRKENALAIAQCEYWSDHLDRWAENLVDPSRSGC